MIALRSLQRVTRPLGYASNALLKGPRWRVTNRLPNPENPGQPDAANVPRNQANPVAVSKAPVQLSGRRSDAIAPQPTRTMPTTKSATTRRMSDDDGAGSNGPRRSEAHSAKRPSATAVG